MHVHWWWERAAEVKESIWHSVKFWNRNQIIVHSTSQGDTTWWFSQKLVRKEVELRVQHRALFDNGRYWSLCVELVWRPPIRETNSAEKNKASFCTVALQMLISQVLPNSWKKKKKKIFFFAHAVCSWSSFPVKKKKFDHFHLLPCENLTIFTSFPVKIWPFLRPSL